jgi:RNA polymerase sigma factor (sigma-70 family)
VTARIKKIGDRGIVSIMSSPMPAGLAEIESLYRTRLGDFRRVARGLLGDPEAARDAVQDAFADAVRNRESFRGEGSLEGWVWRTVVNAARMQRRARQARPTSPLADADSTANGHEPDGDARVRATVAALPERQRLILFLRYYADLDYATIAEALDISTGTVAATLSSARSSLRRLLPEAHR